MCPVKYCTMSRGRFFTRHSVNSTSVLFVYCSTLFLGQLLVQFAGLLSFQHCLLSTCYCILALANKMTMTTAMTTEFKPHLEFFPVATALCAVERKFFVELRYSKVNLRSLDASHVQRLINTRFSPD